MSSNVQIKPLEKLGRIYKIWSPQTDKIYIGSTIQTLMERLYLHRSDLKKSLQGGNKNISSIQITKYGDYKIELIEEYKFINKIDLRKREGYYIQKYKDICINKQMPGRPYKETLKIAQKKYFQTHKEQWRKYLKDYRLKKHLKELEKTP